MTAKNLCLEHIVRPPSRISEKAPTLIMLHGYGSNEQDLFSFAPEFDDSYLIVSARAPLSMQGGGHAWYEIGIEPGGTKFVNDGQALKSRDLIARFIDEVIADYPANPEQLVLFGFSQGAILSYAVSLSFPQKVSRVVAMSGYVHEELLEEGYEKNDFSHLRMYCSHGSVDQVVPVAWDRKTKPFLDSLNIENHYSEFPVGHGVCPQNFAEIKTWLDKSFKTSQ